MIVNKNTNSCCLIFMIIPRLYKCHNRMRKKLVRKLGAHSREPTSKLFSALMFICGYLRAAYVLSQCCWPHAKSYEMYELRLLQQDAVFFDWCFWVSSVAPVCCLHLSCLQMCFYYYEFWFVYHPEF